MFDNAYSPGVARCENVEEILTDDKVGCTRTGIRACFAHKVNPTSPMIGITFEAGIIFT